ncbi:nucleotide exchange factor GrpE [Geminocystis sp. NIES-3709]|uniref:nucleotide exchange factor GrpE n=1 Tax=Geminocystis sp. NIES-3709 TaxID=1617448 RepID=UPI0008266F8E|nr:nucleotide exchange factor GrpE [Geminocystis sp. NIES-3709]
MSETDNYPDLEQEIEMADKQENSEPEQMMPDENSTTLKTDLTSDQVSCHSEDLADESIEELTLEVESEPETTTSQENEQPQSCSIDEATQSYINQLEEEITALKAKLETEIEQGKTFQGQYMRLTADFDNFRRRTTKEKEELEHVIKKRTIMEFLPVVDNFERARTQIKPANDGELNIHKSYQGVYKTFVDSLKKIGVSAMRPEGQPFDPNYHEAMLREPTKEYEEGIVMEQLVRGYLLNNEVLRYAMVKVAAIHEEESENTETIENLSEDN